ncbi:hypothetical protein UlMin_001006 [Ulmus minor]
MVNLLLSEPVWDDVGDTDSSKMMISLLTKLESVLLPLLTSGGRSEARLWLYRSIAGLSSISLRHQSELFMSLLRSKPTKYNLASQLLRMIFDTRPQKAGSVISKKSHVLEKFFAGNSTCILQWFSTFSASVDGLEHGKGAKALSQFAFINRDICWDELEWKGKHGQSPAVVATKPHYFLDLDVLRTVENFIENVPEFWSSPEFAESLKDGEILSIDRKFFLEYFMDLMYKENSRDVWDIITDFLTEESFSNLCHHLLITLEEKDLCKFLDLLCKFLDHKIELKEPKDVSNSSFLFEVILSKYSDFGSFDQILLLNAVLTKNRELLRLLRDEGDNTQAEIKDIVSQICTIPDHDNSSASLIKGCFKMKTIEAIRWLGLYSWVLYYRLSEEIKTTDSWELLFEKNAISFRKCNTYSLVHHDALSEDSGSDLDYTASRKLKHRKKRSRKKRKKNVDLDDDYDSKLLDFDTTNDGLGLLSNSGSWLLSTDGYSTSWSSVDLPEYLSQHCLSTWKRWIFAKWRQ